MLRGHNIDGRTGLLLIIKKTSPPEVFEVTLLRSICYLFIFLVFYYYYFLLGYLRFCYRLYSS
jgi:hypothetical protein